MFYKNDTIMRYFSAASCLKSSGLFIAVLLFSSAHPQVKTSSYLTDAKAGARGKNFDTEHLLLEVTFAPDSGLVKGKVTLSFIALQQETDTLFLDAPGITIKSVQLDSKNVQHSTNASGITIRPDAALQWNSKHQLTIVYEAQPRKGIYFIGWNQPEPANPNLFTVRRQIWTQGQGIDNRYWIPCFDDMNDKLISEVKVTFDKSYRILSNGDLLTEQTLPDGKNKLWHYKMPHPHAPYLIMLGIGKYDVKQLKSKSGVTLDCWYYPEYPERVAPTYRYSTEMMDWMEKEFGVPYPWGKKYSQIPVQDFMYGAMENTTATVFGDFSFIDERAYLDRNYVSTNAHELAHMWFGDYVTARGGEGTWLQESFATHYQKHFERSMFGEDHFQWNRRQELESVLNAAKRDNNPIVHTGAGGERVYQKGSLVLDMLKYVIGREQFNKALTHYLKKHPYQNVDTHDFYIAFLETLGINLDWFFEQWLYKGGEPKYSVRHEELADINGKRFTRFTVKQMQDLNELVGLFKMPIWFEVHYTDGTSDRKQEWISEQTHTVDIPNHGGKQIDYMLFDPNSEIIKAVDFPKSVVMLRAQAQKAKNMIDRHDALVALGKEVFMDKRDILLEAFSKESFHANRAEIARALAAHIYDADSLWVQRVIADKHPKVRLAFLQAISEIPATLVPWFEPLLNDSSYAVIENVLVKLCDENPAKLPEYLSLTKNVEGMSNNVRVRWLEMGFRIEYKTVNLPKLIALTGPQYEFRTRNNAMESLKRLNYLDKTAVANLFDAALSANNRMRNPAKALLKHFMLQTEYKKLIENYYSNGNWNEWQRPLLAELF